MLSIICYILHDADHQRTVVPGQDMINMIDSVEVFVNHMDSLIGVFDTDYQGGEFCAGLTFGFEGSNLLYRMASILIHHNIKQMKKA